MLMEGITLMVIGLTAVFLVLFSVILATNASAFFISKYFAEAGGAAPGEKNIKLAVAAAAARHYSDLN